MEQKPTKTIRSHQDYTDHLHVLPGEPLHQMRFLLLTCLPLTYKFSPRTDKQYKIRMINSHLQRVLTDLFSCKFFFTNVESLIMTAMVYHHYMMEFSYFFHFHHSQDVSDERQRQQRHFAGEGNDRVVQPTSLQRRDTLNQMETDKQFPDLPNIDVDEILYFF